MNLSNIVKYLSVGLLLAGSIFTDRAWAAFTHWQETVQAENCRFDEERVEIVKQKKFSKNKGVALKASVRDRSSLRSKNKESDLEFTFDIPQDGLYALQTVAVVDSHGAALMKKAKSKYDSLFVKLQVPGNRITRRVVYVPWRSPNVYASNLGLFNISAGKQVIKIDLPKGVRLDQLKVYKYKAPPVPEDARKYVLPFKVPRRHPRLLVNPRELTRMRLQIKHPENAPYWEKLREIALKPRTQEFDTTQEIGYMGTLLNILRCKAFYYLITGNETVGREAVALTRKYISCVEFGNLLDITRENGETIYTASLVYDWCYDLLSTEDKKCFLKELRRLSRTMECGWPPFRQYITVGHGNEAQINRDLLSMAVAVYNEDPEPLKYCTYQVFERLLPLRNFEYRSARHSQGLSYASFRFRWEMYAAIIYQRLLEREVFADGLKNMGYYWLNMQNPDGIFFRDGDGLSWSKRPISALVMLLCSTYSKDPVLKGAFMSADMKLLNPFEFLLFNNTDLVGKSNGVVMNRAFDFGPVYPGMSVRTNWEIGDRSQAAAAMVRGGGFHAGNHQHCDAGDFQITYRGQIISPLGMYKFYGTPYDLNFNKRSVSRSMLLVRDPKEKFLGGRLHNDGGSRFIDLSPFTLNMLTKGELPASIAKLRLEPDTRKRLNEGTFFKYGTRLAASFEPNAQKPVFSIYSADLKGAYSDKVKNLVRTFAFIDLNKKDTPAVAVVYDQLIKRSPELAAYWQVTTLVKPEQKLNDLILSSFRHDKAPRGKMLLQMVKPAFSERKLEILTRKDAHNVFGTQYTPPNQGLPEAKGSRVMYKHLKKSAEHEFLITMSLYAAESKPVPVKVMENADCYTILAGDRALVLGKGITPVQRNLSIKLPENRVAQIAFYNLQPGVWQLFNGDKQVKKAEVKADNLTFHYSGKVSDLKLIRQK